MTDRAMGVASLSRLAVLEGIVYPGHGAPYEDGAAAAVAAIQRAAETGG
jgi:hypothetical protein